jgi:hypothetical protein
LIQKEKVQLSSLSLVWVYEQIIKQVEKGLPAALQIIHNFVHEDSDTLKMAPLCSNVEYAYTSQLLLLQDILHTSFTYRHRLSRSAPQVI